MSIDPVKQGAACVVGGLAAFVTYRITKKMMPTVVAGVTPPAAVLLAQLIASSEDDVVAVQMGKDPLLNRAKSMKSQDPKLPLHYEVIRSEVEHILTEGVRDRTRRALCTEVLDGLEQVAQGESFSRPYVVARLKLILLNQTALPAQILDSGAAWVCHFSNDQTSISISLTEGATLSRRDLLAVALGVKECPIGRKNIPVEFARVLGRSCQLKEQCWSGPLKPTLVEVQNSLRQKAVGMAFECADEAELVRLMDSYVASEGVTAADIVQRRLAWANIQGTRHQISADDLLPLFTAEMQWVLAEGNPTADYWGLKARAPQVPSSFVVAMRLYNVRQQKDQVAAANLAGDIAQQELGVEHHWIHGLSDKCVTIRGEGASLSFTGQQMLTMTPDSMARAQAQVAGFQAISKEYDDYRFFSVLLTDEEGIYRRQLESAEFIDSSGRQGQARPDYYAVLEVPQDATAAQIKKSYYKLAMRYHPDKNPDDAVAEEHFKQVSEAYECLSDAEQRAIFDQEKGVVSNRNLTARGLSVKERLDDVQERKRSFEKAFDTVGRLRQHCWDKKVLSEREAAQLSAAHLRMVVMAEDIEFSDCNELDANLAVDDVVATYTVGERQVEFTVKEGLTLTASEIQARFREAPAAAESGENAGSESEAEFGDLD